MINEIRLSGIVNSQPIYKAGKSLEFELLLQEGDYSFAVAVVLLGKSADYNKSILAGDSVLLLGELVRISKNGQQYLGAKAHRLYKITGGS